MIRTLAACTLVLATASTMSAQPEKAPGMGRPETVTVSGAGRARVVPDRVTFTVSVQTVADTLDQALNENNSRVASVVAALKKAGTKDNETRTSGFSINPQQDYSQQGKLPRIIGYQVSNSVTVTRDDVTAAGRLLQVAVNAGVNQSSGLQFEVSDPARGRDEGLKAAFDDARSKAALLAKAAGRTLGRALAIDEGSGQGAGPRPMFAPQAMMAKSAAVSEVPVEGGENETSYGVTVTFQLQ